MFAYSILQLLEEVCAMGRDSRYVCQKPQPKNEAPPITMRSQSNDAGSSDDDEDEDEIASTTSHSSQVKQGGAEASSASTPESTL